MMEGIKVRLSKATVLLLFLMAIVFFVGSALQKLGYMFLKENLNAILSFFALGFLLSEARDIPFGFNTRKAKWFSIIVIMLAILLGMFIVPPIFGFPMPFLEGISPFLNVIAYGLALILMFIGEKRNEKTL